MFFNTGYGLNKNIIYGLLIILAVISLFSMGVSGWINILLTLPAVLLSISCHEFAHANAADKLGDTTPRSQGRLTLNPIKHLDFTGFILMMFTHIGWGKPVEINPNNFVNSNKSRAFCETMVALAGPLMNFFLAVVSVIIMYAMDLFLPNASRSLFMAFFYNFIPLFSVVNIGLGVFNLIPLPPLDGEKIFRNFLPYNAREWLQRNYYTLYWVFMILWMFGFLDIVVGPLTYGATNLIYTGVSKLFGLFVH